MRDATYQHNAHASNTDGPTCFLVPGIRFLGLRKKPSCSWWKMAMGKTSSGYTYRGLVNDTHGDCRMSPLPQKTQKRGQPLALCCPPSHLRPTDTHTYLEPLVEEVDAAAHLVDGDDDVLHHVLVHHLPADLRRHRQLDEAHLSEHKPAYDERWSSGGGGDGVSKGTLVRKAHTAADDNDVTT